MYTLRVISVSRPLSMLNSTSLTNCLYPTDNWHWESHPFKKLDFGKWELHLPPNEDGSPAIKHMSEIKVIIRNHSGQLLDRLSPWAKYVVQPPKSANQGVNYKQYVWEPPSYERYQRQHQGPARPKSLRIYECHVGIASQEPRVGSYADIATAFEVIESVSSSVL